MESIFYYLDNFKKKILKIKEKPKNKNCQCECHNNLEDLDKHRMVILS